MSNPVIVDLFVEDRAHEEFLKPLIARIATEEDVHISARVRSARGGHGRAIQELKLYRDLVEKDALGEGHPDLLIVAIDGNCMTFARKRTEIQTTVRAPFSDRLVVACPDPHVERWYLADPNSFQSVVGRAPAVRRKKCMRDHYKNALTKAVREAGHPVTLGGIEFAPELVAAMDLHRAGRTDHSLRAFVDDLRGKLRQASNR
jgi:hypothetical protein